MVIARCAVTLSLRGAVAAMASGGANYFEWPRICEVWFVGYLFFDLVMPVLKLVIGLKSKSANSITDFPQLTR
jgi:hypothetical protein